MQIVDKFLGDQKASYNQELKFKLRVGQAGAVPRQDDLIIMSGGEKRVTKISMSLTDQNNPVPGLSVRIKHYFKKMVISNFLQFKCINC